MDKPYGLIRLRPDVHPMALKYATREERDAKAREYAQRDQFAVQTEEWKRANGDGDYSWWLTGRINYNPMGRDDLNELKIDPE